jgi:dTMP kinase
MLASYLEKKGFKVTLTREPGGTGCKIAEAIRAMLLNPDHIELCHRSEFLLFLAARAQHIQDVIAPALDAGHIVLCDRYFDSSWAYQLYARNIVGELAFEEMGDWAMRHKDKIYYPDLTLMLDVNVEIGSFRANQRNRRAEDQKETRIDNEALEFHTKVNEGYRKRALLVGPRIVTIDANRSIDAIQVDVQEAFETGYAARLQA